MSRGPIVAFGTLILILLAPGLVLAEMEEDSVTLGPGDSWVITIRPSKFFCIKFIFIFC